MQKIKGSVLRARLAFVEQQFGKSALQRVLASLSSEDQTELSAVGPSAWFAFALGRRLDDAIVTVLAGGKREFFERLGEASAEKNLATIHKSFLVYGDPHAFLEKAPHIYTHYYQTGRREYVRTGETEGVMTTFDAETFSSADCLTVIGWYKKALELCGARGVKIVEEECRARGGEVCRYRLSWK
jgi:uncharacterized protein (TIGR02265 family)